MSVERAFLAVRIIIGGFFSVILLSACTRSVARATPSLATTSAPSIQIESVQVMPYAGIYVTGSTSLHAGSCLKTELLADDKSQAWWPRDFCIEMGDTGQWELLVALGRNGAPQQLESGRQYQLRAWWPEEPEFTTTRFYFDLDGPQNSP